MEYSLRFILVAFLLSAVPAWSIGLHPSTRFTLVPGTPLFQEMDDAGGIAETLDQEARQLVTIADYPTVQRERKAFEADVFAKLIPFFADGEKGFQKLVEALAGQRVNVRTAVPAIAKALQDGALLKDAKQIGLSATRLAPPLLLASGGGTEIALGAKWTTYHYGFKPGDDTAGAEDDKTNRVRTKSGRSYATSATRAALDPSDIYFLTEANALVSQWAEPWPFYHLVFQILTRSDASGIESLPPAAQTVLSDWFAIYIAEQRRHRMTGWAKMDWENALTELLMLAPYTARANQIRNVQGAVINGTLVDYFGVGTDGSGLGGKAGAQRRIYTHDISVAMAKRHPAEHRRLATLIGVADDHDLLSGLMAYLNDRANEAAVARDGAAIEAAAVAYLHALRDSAREVAAELSGR